MKLSALTMKSLAPIALTLSSTVLLWKRKATSRKKIDASILQLRDRGGLGWLSGFDEAIVRCGLDSTGAPGPDIVPNNMGIPTEVELTLHGKIANLPAWRVEISVLPGDPDKLIVVGRVQEAGLFCPQYELVAIL